jgi:hypothetical protein
MQELIHRLEILTLKDGLHPGDFVIEAWKTEKLMRV